MDFDLTKRVLAALETHGVRYAVFGAVALNLHGLARFTPIDDISTERIALDDVTVSVVTPQTLYEMKRDTVRLKDKADAQALKERFGLKD